MVFVEIMQKVRIRVVNLFGPNTHPTDFTEITHKIIMYLKKIKIVFSFN